MNKKEIVEINGVKFEVDLSTAKVVTEYCIGDKVNVLVKEYSEKAVYPGIIVGFDNFKTLPTITIAYLKLGYNNAELKFVHFNTDSKDFDIAPCRESDLIFRKNDVLAQMDREIEKNKQEVRDLEGKKNYFLSHFTKHFESVAPVTEDQEV